jgi:hypothetical protein
MNTQLLRYNMFEKHLTFPLIPRTMSGFERTGRTKRIHPTRLRRSNRRGITLWGWFSGAGDFHAPAARVMRRPLGWL